MQGAREALAAGAVHIERQIVALEGAVEGNPGLAFDLAKALIESTCKTVLIDRGHPVDDNLDLPRLLKDTLGRLRLVPDSYASNSEVVDGLRKTVGGFQTVIQGICELRNLEGFASHGRDGFAEQLEATQAQLVARAADTIVNFIFRVHRGYSSRESTRRIAYEEHPEFNKYVDESHDPVAIFEMDYRPSEVLFQVDREAYRNVLATFGDVGSSESGGGET